METLKMTGQGGSTWEPTLGLRTVLSSEGWFSHIEQAWRCLENGEVKWQPIPEVRHQMFGGEPVTMTRNTL